MSRSPRAAAAPLRRLDSRLSRRGLLGAGVLAGVLAASGVQVAARPCGGVLRLGLAAPLPLAGSDWPAWADGPGGIAETLTEIGPRGELLPGLALGWDSDPEARDWRFRLDRAARFHDGAPLTALDVAASIRGILGGIPGGPLADVEDIAEDGPQALRVRLVAPDPDLPLRLAGAGAGLAVWRPDGLGTGPYRPDAGGAPMDGALRLVRVEGHRIGRAGAHFDTVELVALPDPRARLDALLAGAVDAVAPLPPDLEREALSAGLAVAGSTPHAPRLGHAAVSPLPLDGGRIAERWWLAA